MIIDWAMNSQIPLHEMEWHHLVPTQVHRHNAFQPGLASQFNNREWGILIDFQPHRGQGGLHPQWNDHWIAWLNNQPTGSVTAERANQQVREMMRKAPFAEILKDARVVPAPVHANQRRYFKNSYRRAFNEMLNSQKPPWRTRLVRQGGRLIRRAPLVGTLFTIPAVANAAHDDGALAATKVAIGADLIEDVWKASIEAGRGPADRTADSLRERFMWNLQERNLATEACLD